MYPLLQCEWKQIKMIWNPTELQANTHRGSMFIGSQNFLSMLERYFIYSVIMIIFINIKQMIVYIHG